jgi:SAM-dependent methyltransferase
MGVAARAFRRLLAEPRAPQSDLDDPRTTARRRQLVREKRFLSRIYEEWYGSIASALPDIPGPTLEIGAGAGFLAERVAGVVTSDVQLVPGVRIVADAAHLPFRSQSLRAVVMTNVLHHLAEVTGFFAEAARCVKPAGRLVMLEPWNTRWSRFVYCHLHHEPFDPDASDWTVTGSGPLSGANGAIPWMLFARDRNRFERAFPAWRVAAIRPSMPFRYLVSGGVSVRSLAPAWTFGAWTSLERHLESHMDALAMFAYIVLVRTDAPPTG